MEREGIGYISPEDSADSYLSIHLSLCSDDNDWNRAIEIFKHRMNGRYFSVIDKLLANAADIEKNGFAIMTLNCLLVDTFYQFRDPDNVYETARRHEQYRRPNGTVYKQFLLHEFPNHFTQNTANYFYKDIRCGILHSAQTKHGSMLTYGKIYVVEVFDGDKIYVDVRNFSRLMKDYYENYLISLRDRNNRGIRSAFIKQMNKIAKA